MKIQKFTQPTVNPYKAAQVKADRTAGKTVARADKLEISNEAKQLSEINTFATTRQEKVQQLREQIEAGTYKVDAKQLASKLLQYYRS